MVEEEVSVKWSHNPGAVASGHFSVVKRPRAKADSSALRIVFTLPPKV